MPVADRWREQWPMLPLEAWADTRTTLHLWMQIVGKIRLAASPWVNHCWNATLYPTATGLTTSLIPYQTRAFQIDFDFLAHQLIVQASDGGKAVLALQPQSVAMFYRRLMQEMEMLEFRVALHGSPNELADAIPFDQDETHGSYDPEVRQPVLANPRASQSCPQRVSRAVHWQMQSGAFLLGRG